MSDSMIERVARAICASHGYNPDSDDEVAIGDPGTLNWECFEDDAIAAITTMREPTELMIEAMYDEYQNGGKGSLRDAYREAIDAALEGDPDQTVP